MTKALYGGSFDPFTNGHLDIVERASKTFEEVIVGISANPEKKYFFSEDEREKLVQESVAHLPNVSVMHHQEGLLVSFAKQHGANVLIRGIRNGLDIDIEEMMADMNRYQEPDIETVFLMAKPKYRFISSTLVKEVTQLGGVVEELVPPAVLHALKETQKK